MMNKITNKQLIIFCFLSFALAGRAQVGSGWTTGAKATAMGQSITALEGMESAWNNQAGLSNLQGLEILLSAENKFLVKHLNSFSFAAAYPARSGVFGLSVLYFGMEAYNEQKIGLAYARNLLDNLSLGAQFDYISVRIPEYGMKGMPTFEIGIRARIFQQLHMGTHIFNPLRIEIIEGEPLPTVINFGIAYMASQKLTITTGVEKDLNHPIRIRAGVEYKLAKALHLLLGVDTNPGTIAFGVGYKLQRFRLEGASSFHQVLGTTPSFSLGFFSSKNQQEP